MSTQQKYSLVLAFLVMGLVWGIGAEALAQEVVTKEELLFREIPIVVTAAKKEQSATEAPAAVTVITAEEIKNMGARNLLDVLKTVPGFNIIQDTNEHLVAMRGIYASTNQKFLLLRDGYRLNEWMWNTIEYDYSQSVENIKRIEVIRSPGASLYGSAALCGVVNIITKDATEIDGWQTKISAGNFGQVKTDILYGKDNLVMWCSYAETSGEKADIAKNRDGSKTPIDGYEYVDHYGPSYDFGLKLKEGNLTFAGSFSNSSYFNPRGNSGQLIEYDKANLPYKQIFRTGNIDLTYDCSLNDMKFKLNHYFDYNYWFSWQLLSPQREWEKEELGKLFRWDVEGVVGGVEYSVSKPLFKGDILFGIQPEYRKLLESTAYQTYASSMIDHVAQDPLKPGDEYYLACYLQTEQKITPQVIGNVGARYDYYKDVGGSLNPRLSLIWNAFKDFYWKLIYNESFLNPSYFYRYVTGVMGYYGGPDLKPEKMNSYQSQIMYYFSKDLTVAVNYFYNNLLDLVAPDTRVAGRYTYRNYGEITVQGVETELKTTVCKVELFANHTFQKPIEDKTDPGWQKDEKIFAIPENTANLGVNYSPIKYLNVNLSGNWLDKTEVKSQNLPQSIYYPDWELPSIMTLNLVFTVKEIFKTAELQLACYNLLNEEYYLGGTAVPYRQQGRWFLISAGYKF
ncbi:MAG: TonB-dependent receptor [Elusimicrobiota bacterium]